jgi:hypothetical protein
MSDSWVLFLDRPGHKIPRTAVGEFRKANEYTVKSKLGDQTLFSDVDNKELVHDSAQQHVPRILNRNITKEDAKALKKKKGISATGPKSRVDIWEHVAGAKPSPYISTTKLDDADIENPHGEPLGGEHGRVRIDLLHVSPKKIFDLTTKKGQDQWQLSNPKTPTRRQVLEDVIRTQEVLIKGEIPPDAIEKF